MPGHYSLERAAVLSAQMGTTSPIDLGPAPMLAVNGVQNLALSQTLFEASISVSLAPLLPAEMGTPVNGFQDGFDTATRNTSWIALGPDVYWQAGGRLNFGAGGGDPNHLIYFNPACAGSAQEILGADVIADGQVDYVLIKAGGLPTITPMPATFQDDPAAVGIIACLLWCTDPSSGIPYNPDSTDRGCTTGHGDHTKNLVLMYQYTRQPQCRERAEDYLPIRCSSTIWSSAA